MAQSSAKYRTVTLTVNGVVRTVYVPADEDNAEALDPFGPQVQKTSAQNTLQPTAQPASANVLQPRGIATNPVNTNVAPSISQPLGSPIPVYQQRPAAVQSNFQVFNLPSVASSQTLLSPTTTRPVQVTNATPALPTTQSCPPALPAVMSSPSFVPSGSTFVLGPHNLASLGLQGTGSLLSPVQPLYSLPSNVPRQQMPANSQIMFLPQQPTAQGTGAVNMFRQPTGILQGMQPVAQATNTSGLLLPGTTIGLLRQNNPLLTTPLLQPNANLLPGKAVDPPKGSPLLPQTPSLTTFQSPVRSIDSSNQVSGPTASRCTAQMLQAIAPKPPPSSTTVIHLKEVPSTTSNTAGVPDLAVEAGVQKLLTALETQDGQQCAKVLETIQQSIKSRTQPLDRNSDGTVVNNFELISSTSKPVQAVGPFCKAPDKGTESENISKKTPPPGAGWERKFAADYTRRSRKANDDSPDSSPEIPTRRQTRWLSKKHDKKLIRWLSKKQDKSVSSKLVRNTKQLRAVLKRKHDEDMKRYCRPELRSSIQLCTVKISKVDLRGGKKARFSDFLTDLYPDIFEK